MTQENSADVLLQPFKLKHLTLKNRVMSTSHAISYQDDGKPKQRYQLYHEEKAKGGIALTMFGGSSNVAPDSPSVFGQLYVGDDSIIPHFQEFSERIHAHDCALMCQLTHMGRRSTSFGGDWLPIIAPSRVREPQHRGFPKEMDRNDIDRVVRSFGDAAKRCADGGLDGCEVMAAGHLVGQFLSRFTNQREDEFGGSVANRTRFALMVFEEIRKAAGDNFVSGIRMPMFEGGEGGLTFEETLEIAELLENAGTIDFFNLVAGRVETELALAEYNMPGMGVRSAPFIEDVARFKPQVNLPVFHAARINDLATARHVVSEGIVDMVGMTRAHIADPHLVAKLQRGEEERIRPCVGATYCNSRRLCIHNAALGREVALPHVISPAAGSKRCIAVVGGGPAGLEAARVSALRGHDVTLFEAASELGGQLVIAARASWRGDLRGVVDWLVSEVGHAGAEVRLNGFVEAADLTSAGFDTIILATGGVPDTGWVEGAEHCVSTWDVLSGAEPRGDDVLVFDGTGVNVAASCADHLAGEGAKVAIVSPDNMLCMEVSYNDRAIQRKRLYERGVDMVLDHGLKRVEMSGNRRLAVLENVLTGVETSRLVDQVIVEHGTLPADELWCELSPRSRNGGVTDIEALLEGAPQPHAELADGEFSLYRIGDAVASRDVHSAIHDALRLCVTL